MKRRAGSKAIIGRAPLFLAGGAWGVLVLVLLSLAFIFSSTIYPKGFESIRTGFADAFSPVLSATGKPIQDTVSFIRSVTGIAELQSENLRLQKENENLREWYQNAMVLEAENKSLRELMNMRQEPQERYVTARIMADSGFSFVKSVLVQAGKERGVKKGQTVVSGEGLVGRIIEAGDQVARVLLVTDINSRVPVLVEDSSQHAVMAGQNDDFPSLIYLPPDSQIEEGSRIITSGYGGLFPYGLAVGRIVFDRGQSPRVQLFADFDRMVHVRVIDQSIDSNLKTGASN